LSKNVPVTKSENDTPVNSHPTIVADHRIPFVREVFEQLRHLIVLPGREMNAITTRDADILIVRSVTRVDEKLLGKSKVQYVATVSTGYDHVNTDYMSERGIHYLSRFLGVDKTWVPEALPESAGCNNSRSAICISDPER